MIVNGLLALITVFAVVDIFYPQQSELRDQVEYVGTLPDELQAGANEDIIPQTKTYTKTASEMRPKDPNIRCTKIGKLPCKITCQQGTLYYPNGCCACICKKNFAITNTTQCTTAAWSSWSAWSKCVEFEWGGLQTRERGCKSVENDAPGSCVGRGSSSRKCSSVKKEFRTRKNVNSLTDEEVHDLIQAMDRFKKDKSKLGYRNIATWHGWPGMCPWYHHFSHHKDNHCSFHHNPVFLPWHRLFVVQLELGLSRYLMNKSLGIPFWDWTDHSTDIPYLLRHSKIYDPAQEKFVHNPFYKTFIKYSQGKKIYTHRHPWYPGLLMDKYIIKGTVRALLSHDYYEFDEQLNTNPHDLIHSCLCVSKKRLFNGERMCKYSNANVSYSALKRRLEELEGAPDWTESRVLGQDTKSTGESYSDITFDWPMSPFCNTSMNPEKLTSAQGHCTMRKAYYDEELYGYRYAEFNLGDNYTWDDLRKDYRRNSKDRDYWNDEYFESKLGPLTKKNSYSLKTKNSCPVKYSNPTWNITIVWRN